MLLDGFIRALLYWSRRTGKCVAENTTVMTPSGPVAVEHLAVGDTVYGYEDGEVNESTVTNVMDNGTKDTYAIRIGGTTVFATKNHRWLTTNGVSTLELGRANIARSMVRVPCGDVHVPHAYAIGALVGDGCCTDSSVYDISSKDEPVVSETARTLGGLAYGKRKSNNHTWFINGLRKRRPSGAWDVATVVPEYSAWLRGRRAHEKLLDWSVVNTWDRESCLALMAGLIDTDGSVVRAETQLRVVFGQQSRSVAETYQKLVFKLWHHRVKIRPDNRPRYVNGPVLEMVVSGNFYSRLMLRELTPYLQTERKKYKPEYDELRTNRNDGYIGVTVSEGGPKKTFDITVSNPSHLYLLADEGLITHNTLWSVQHLKLASMIRQGPYHIVFKEYQQAETVAWNQYLHTIEPELIKKTDKSTLTITFNYFEGTIKFPPPIGTVTVAPDYSKPPSSIRLLGSDKADSHRGGESNGMIFDEYQDQDTYGWDFVYKYFLATTNGWACFMGTAKDEDHWTEMIDKAQSLDNWYFSKATWRENPLIKSEWIEQERLEAELEHRLGPFLQETELIPFSQQGAVYPMFHKEIHVIKPQEVPDEGTDYIALDFGFAEGHPMAACFIRITRDDIWYQWDEIHGSGIQIDDAIAEIRIKMGDRQLTAIIADSARPDLIDYMQSKALPVIPAPKSQNSIASGIQLLAKRLRPKIQIIGDPKPNYYVTNNCKKTIYDFTHYRYKEVKENRHPMENPEKRFDDSMDSIRYLALWFRYGASAPKDLPKSSGLGTLNEYGL